MTMDDLAESYGDAGHTAQAEALRQEIADLKAKAKTKKPAQP